MQEQVKSDYLSMGLGYEASETSFEAGLHYWFVKHEHYLGLFGTRSAFIRQLHFACQTDSFAETGHLCLSFKACCLLLQLTLVQSLHLLI